MLMEGYRFDADLLHEEYQEIVKERNAGFRPSLEGKDMRFR